jgi:hypothetical protein
MLPSYREPRHPVAPDIRNLGYQSYNAQEAGYPAPEASQRRNHGFPPGGGKALVPHFVSFSAIVNHFTRVYRNTFDEAQKFSRQYSVAMRNEPVIMDPLRSLQIPASMVSSHLDADDPEDPFQDINCQGLERIYKRTPRFQQFKRCLLEGCFYGRYGVQQMFKWDYTYGQKNLVCRKWYPVNGDKLIFRYNDQVGILVHSTWNLRNTAITDRGRAYFLTPEEREALIVHEFEPEDSDFFDGEMAGAIHGVGFRGRLFWVYWLRQQVLAWVMEYLERVGAGGLTIYYYEAGNPQSLAEVKAAAEAQLNNNCLLFPRYRDNKGLGPGIDRLDPSNSGVQLIINLVNEYFDLIITHYIMGQTLSSQAGATGLGSGVAELHGDTKGERIKYICGDLDDTLTEQWIAVLNKYNCPGNPCPRYVSEVDKPNVAEYMDGVAQYVGLGGEVDAEATRSMLALPPPRPGRPILGMPQPMMGPDGQPMEDDGGESDGNEEGPSEQMSRRARRMSKKVGRKVRDTVYRNFGPKMARLLKV